jgi:hypothetical protein
MRTRAGWKVYAWLLAVVQVCAYTVGFASIKLTPSETALSLTDLAVNVIGMVGLFGFAYQRPIGSARIWRLAFSALVAWHLVCVASSAFGGRQQLQALDATLGIAAIAALAVVLFGPAYMALFRYGYRESGLWLARSAS